MTAQEYGLWMAWHLRDPLDASWWQAGMQASLTANVNRSKGADPFVATDFMPTPWQEKVPEPEIDIRDFVEKING